MKYGAYSCHVGSLSCCDDKKKNKIKNKALTDIKYISRHA